MYADKLTSFKDRWVHHSMLMLLGEQLGPLFSNNVGLLERRLNKTQQYHRAFKSPPVQTLCGSSSTQSHKSAHTHTRRAVAQSVAVVRRLQQFTRSSCVGVQINYTWRGERAALAQLQAQFSACDRSAICPDTLLPLFANQRVVMQTFERAPTLEKSEKTERYQLLFIEVRLQSSAV